MALSLLLLALITLNGAIKYWLNVYSGVIGERALRRLRHDLYQQVLRFPLPQFKTMSSGEIIPMIVAETDPIGGFIGESISLPAFQGGLLVTYMVFIFLQDFWLGLAAVALYPPQVWLIPRLQKKINQLSKERVQQARALSDRIGETVAGAAEIRGNDTFHRERADISDRLGKIYAIRFDIFKRKFFVKFLNNFLGQITPFFFYSVGGYLVIKGSLSLGALVAVLAAYKDILAPWKELLTWYSTKEDMRIKYEQIVSQFEPPGILDVKLVEEPPASVPPLVGEIAATGVTYAEEGGTNRVDRASFNIAAGEHVALVGGGHSGKDDVTQLLARLVFASGGRIAVAGQNFLEVHQAVPGRRIAYATQNAYIFSGTAVPQPLLRPHASAAAPGDLRRGGRKARADPRARRADLGQQPRRRPRGLDRLRSRRRDGCRRADGGGAHRAPARRDGARGHRLRAREHVGSASPAVRRGDESGGAGADPGPRATRRPGVVRRALRSHSLPLEHQRRGKPALRNAAKLRRSSRRTCRAIRSSSRCCARSGCWRTSTRRASRWQASWSSCSRTSLPTATFSTSTASSARTTCRSSACCSRRSRTRRSPRPRTRRRRVCSRITFRLVAAQHRLGVIDDEMQRKVVEARAEFRRRYTDRDDLVEFFEPDRFSSTLSIQDNILFGRVALEQANAQGRVNALVREVAGEVGMNAELVRLGLEYEVGNGGSRLSYSQRQRLAIARAIMKNPDIVVFNEPTSGLDPATESRVMSAVLEWAKGRTVVWALGRADLARSFDRVLVFEDGRLVEQGTFAELERPGSQLTRLLG